jgi:hypothetical protein
MELIIIIFAITIITVMEQALYNNFYDNTAKNFDKKLEKGLKELDDYWKGVVSAIYGDTIVDVVKLDPYEITIIFENLNCKIIRLKDYKLVNNIKDIYGNLQLKLIKENEQLKFEIEQLKNRPTTVCYMKCEPIAEIHKPESSELLKDNK